MLILVIVFGIANKIKIVESSLVSETKHPELMILTPTISLVICLLYLVEDNVIGALSEYCRAVCLAEKAINPSTKILRNYDSSQQLLSGNESKWTKRILIQVFLFVIIPVTFSFIGFIRVTSSNNLIAVLDNLMTSVEFMKWSFYHVVFWFGVIMAIITSVVIYFGNKNRLEFKNRANVDSILTE